MARQKSIANKINIEGIGLHSGEKVVVRFEAAPPDTGVYFIREDLTPCFKIKTEPQNVCHTFRSTNLGNGRYMVKTVEHLLAAVWAMGIDNLIIRLYGEEIPIFDGSSQKWIELLKSAGLVEQNRERKKMQISSPLIVGDGEKYIKAFPNKGLRIRYIIDFPHTPIGKQEIDINIDEEKFITEIAPARTFGFYEEASCLYENNLARGANLENCIVVTNSGFLCNLRYPDEMVRHKVLDLIGDISLLGKELHGYIIAFKANHSLHLKLIKELY